MTDKDKDMLRRVLLCMRTSVRTHERLIGTFSLMDYQDALLLISMLEECVTVQPADVAHALAYVAAGTEEG